MTAIGSRSPAELLAGLRGRRHATDPVTHVEHLAARQGTYVDWPAWAPAEVVDAFVRAGVRRPWAHQIAAAQSAWDGDSVIIATGTASGKSLAYQLPVLTKLLADPRATALYLTPTKALAADQLRAITGLELPGVRAAGYDGDTPTDERDWVRAHSRFVFSNPDMIHRSLLPGHTRWQSFLRRLTFVVVDECHSYRGVFGSHVAAVLRRLRRVCARYGSEPVFICASATVSEPAVSAQRLTGLPAVAVTDDASPRGATTFVLWEPPLGAADGENGAPVRRAAVAEVSDLLTDLVLAGSRTLAFVRSRRSAEMVAMSTQRSLSEVAPELAGKVAAYRAGYLSDERRAIERALRSGELLGVAATNALELGVDVTGLDAVLLAGYPGRLASLWQQAGRAGRAGRDALAVLVARDDPLDTYLVHHPEAIFGRPVEATVLDPTNPYVWGPTAVLRGRRTAADQGRRGAFRRRPGRARAGRPGGGRAAADPAHRVVLDLTAASRRRHPGHRRRAGGGRRGRHRPAAGHGRRGSLAQHCAPGRGLHPPGRGLPGRRVRPGGVHRARTRRGPGLDHPRP
nr:DEAD/DEAH box helicase [Fodinicola feengrottensis]